MRRGTEIGNTRGRFIFQRAFFQVTRFLYQFLLLVLTLFPIRVNKLYQSIKVRRPRWCWRKRHETENDPNHRDICQVDRWSLPMIQQRQTSSQKKRKHIKWKLVEREQSEILALSQHSMRINNTNSKFRSCAFAIISMDEYLIPPKRILFSAGDGEKKRRRENVETKISIWILTTLTNFHPRYLSLKITVYINSHSPTQRRERATHNIKWTWWWWGHGKENPRFVCAFNSERDSRRSTFCPSSIRASRCFFQCCFSFGVGKK